MTTHDSPASFLPAIEEIALGAGSVLMRHFRRLGSYEKKGTIDLVTIADREAEDFVVGEVERRFPEHAILGEEGGRRGNAASDYLWVVDPLDGTTNYAHGMRLFAVSIGLLYRGEPIAGAVYAPALDELYTAAKGHGARRNGDVLRVSAAGTLEDSLIVTGFPYDRAARIDELMAMMRAALLSCRGVLRLGAASLDFAAVAAGNLEAFYELGLKPWDMAAGVLLVTEAGGAVSAMEPGAGFDLFSGSVLASNGAVHEALRAQLANA